MKKIIIFSLTIISVLNVWAQNTKAEEDSAYINNDYVKAIEIYEALLQEGEAAEL